MSQLPDYTALGERPLPTVPRRTPNIATYDPTSGFEDAASQNLQRDSTEMEQAVHYAIQAKEQSDTLGAEAAFNTYREKQLGFRQEMLNLRGADAANRDLPGEYGAKMDAVGNTLANGLANDYQKTLFANRALGAKLQLQEEAVSHQAQQTNVYAKQTLDGTLDVESRLVSAGAPIQTSLVRNYAAIDREAQRSGWSEASVMSEKMKVADRLWSSKIEGMIPSDPLGAKKLYDEPEINTLIGPQNKVVLEHQLKSAIQPIQAKGVADEALKSILTHWELTGAGADTAPDSIPGMLGLKGDPQELARQFAQDVNMPSADREAALIQLKSQATAPGGLKPVANTRVEVLSKIGEGLLKTQQLAEQQHPGDPVFADMAEQQFMTHLRRVASATDGVAQQATQTVENDLIKNGYTSLDQALANPQNAQVWGLIAPTNKRWMLQLMDHNARAAAGEFTKSDPELFNSLRQRFYLPDGDPNRITSQAQLTPFFANGINAPDSERLRKELNEANTPEGNPFLKQTNTVKKTAEKMLIGSVSNSNHPEYADEAAYRFGVDLDSKIKAARAAGKDPQDLFVPGTKDYVLDPSRVAAFMPSESEIKAREAGAKVKPAPATTYQTAVNPKTGERLILKDGKWQAQP